MTTEKTYVFFDLDGTLSDSGPGIINALRYMIDKEGYDTPSDEVLRGFIGPPLLPRVCKVFNLSEEKAAESIKVYREYYNEIGLYENTLYPHIKEMLTTLKDAGVTLLVVTSKPDILAKKTLKYFDIDHFFTDVQGPPMAPNNITKTSLLETLLERNDIDAADAILVGDRKFDVNAATDCGMPCIGVLFGFGDREELEKAGAAHLVNDVPQLTDLLMKLCGK